MRIAGYDKTFQRCSGRPCQLDCARHAGSRFAGPEKASVYEAGLKGNWGRTSANLAVFKQVIRGFQSNIFTGTGFFLANAGKQSTWGVEFEGNTQPIPGLSVGVGLTSQYLEQFGRKLLGGLLGGVAGKMGRGLGGAATGMAFSFATTYALGQVARRYYAGGRVMSTALLRESFQELLGPAKQLQAQYLPQIRQKAATLDAGQIMAMVRGR